MRHRRPNPSLPTWRAVMLAFIAGMAFEQWVFGADRKVVVTSGSHRG